MPEVNVPNLWIAAGVLVVMFFTPWIILRVYTWWKRRRAIPPFTGDQL